MKKLLTVASALLALFIFNGCDDEPDYRDDLVGTYTGYVEYSETDGEQKDDGTYASELIVSKGSSDNTLNIRIKDKYGVEHLFYAEKLKEVGNEFVFKMRTVNDGGTVYCGLEELYKILGQQSKDELIDCVFDIESNKMIFDFSVVDAEEEYLCMYLFDGRK